MFRPRVIPILLLKNKGLVKTIQFKKDRYIGDPINAVRIFNNLGADELIFLDIMATKEKRTISVELVRQIGDEVYMPFGVGGGIASLSDAMKLINAGAEKIILNTQAYHQPKLIKAIASEAGSQSVVVSVDFRKTWIGTYEIYVNGGREKVRIPPGSYLKLLENEGAGEIIINSMNNDGMMCGFDLEMIRKFSKEVNIPVVACGGAGNLNDLNEANRAGAHATAAGSLFVFHGQRRAVLINYPDKKELIKIFN